MTKIIRCAFLATFALLPFLPAPSDASVLSKPVVELIELLTKRGGKPFSRPAEEALEAAFKKHGAKALEATSRNGRNLAEAAAQHGDDVYKFALRVPEAAPLLATRSAELLPVARGLGSRAADFLRIEARAPGLGEMAIKAFPSKRSASRLLRLPADDMFKVVSLAPHCVDRQASRTLLRAVEKKGPGFLQKLDSRHIFAAGLSTSMIIMASGLTLSVPERLVDSLENLATGPALIISAAVAIAILLLAWKLIRPLSSRLGKKTTPHAHAEP